MPIAVVSRLLAAALLALALSACAARNQLPVAAGNDDDDAYCRAGGAAAGSSEYVACRKDRDARRSSAIARANTRQRELGEYMLNHPDRP